MTSITKCILSALAILMVLALPVWGTDFSEFKTADDLWSQVEKTVKEIATTSRAQYVGKMEDLRAGSLEFEKRFPSDPRHWDARLLRLQVEFAQAQIAKRSPDMPALVASLKEIAAAPDASASVKADASFFAVDTQLQAPGALESLTNAAVRAALDADITTLRKDYPDELRTAMTQFTWVNILRTQDPQRGAAILRDLANSKDPRVAGEAHRQLDTIQMQRKLAEAPLDLKFRALDGTEVDLAKLRGKVVLVDFWAVWCGPCRLEIPNVVATYKQLHTNGFEIVGISLDQDKEKLISFTKQAEMSWPQYFDGKMWSNEISSRFGINEIPAMWLVDKKGYVRSTEARGSELTEQVKKLLAE